MNYYFLGQMTKYFLTPTRHAAQCVNTKIGDPNWEVAGTLWLKD